MTTHRFAVHLTHRASPLLAALALLACSRAEGPNPAPPAPTPTPTPPTQALHEPSPQPAPAPPTPWATFTFTSMGTRMSVTVHAPDEERARSIVPAVFDEVDREASEWKATSPLSAVNAVAGNGELVVVPRPLFTLVARALELARLTDGAFEPTWAALWGLWDFKANPPSVPSDADIAARLPLVDYRAVELDPERAAIRLPRAGMKLGLGGIGKGYALDLAAARLREAGIEDFLLSAGGQIYAGGTRDGRPWKVGIRDPRGAEDDHFALLEVHDASVSTSGDYERYFVVDGVRHHHILDPKTGRPSRGLRSATTIASDATLADALSTAFMVLGRERALAALERFPGVGLVLVDEQGKVTTSPGLESLLITHEPTP